MSDQKHTPGPWEATSRKDGTIVATTYRNAHNAAFIAAAPDMRDAVHSLLAEIDARCEDMRDAGCYEGTLLTAIEEARAALAKAEGR